MIGVQGGEGIVRTRKTIAIIVALMASISLLAAGCAPAPSASPTHTPIVTPARTVSPTEFPTLTPGSTPLVTSPPLTPGVTMGSLSGEGEAAKIAAEVEKLSEIGKAVVVVSNEDALVGVQFTAQYQGEMTERIKDMVAERVKTADSRVKNTAVTADADMFSRISAMFSGLKGGATAAIGTEFAEIFNRVHPKTS